MDASLADSFNALLNGHTLERYYVAYSGGVDSHVLLHLAVQAKLPVVALHINHGLQSAAESWMLHCAEQCRLLACPIEVRRVNATAAPGESKEAAARNARYAAFAQFSTENSCIMLAHHQDDQAETLLLQLLRGAGLKGLSAMPRVAMFNQAVLLRPLLHHSRDAILSYAHEHQLNWINDLSNDNLDYDRNYLRHEILPKLKLRWPSAAKTISRSSEHCAKAEQLLNELAAADYSLSVSDHGLKISALKKLSLSRLENVLRFWLTKIGQRMLSTQQLQHLITDVIFAAMDKNPQLKLGSHLVRRYQDELYVVARTLEHDISEVVAWNYAQKLTLAIPKGFQTEARRTRRGAAEHTNQYDRRESPVQQSLRLKGDGYSSGFQLQLVPCVGQGIKAQCIETGRLTIRYRQQGELFHPQGRVGSHPLKKLFQEWRVPPWLRNKTPLLYIDEQLAAVIGYRIGAEFAAGPDELGYQLVVESI